MFAAKTTGTQGLNNVKDPYFSYNSLLLHGEGYAGSNNTLFFDTSSNTYIPFNGTYSNYFNGTSAYLVASSSTNYALGTGDFTIECWIYPTSWTNDNGTFIDFRQGTSVSDQVKPRLFLTGGTLTLYVSLVNRITTTLASLNTWYHIALVRSSGSTKLYVNGVQGGSTYTDANDYGSVAQDFVIGQVGYSRALATGYFAGYISNVRITKVALYTATFTVPTAPLSALPNTVFLSSQSPLIKDNSTYNLTITNNNTTVSAGAISNNTITTSGNPLQGTFSPFSTTGWSNYFLGSATSYLSFPASANYLFGTNDFTMEMWAYPTTFATQQGLMASHQIGGMFQWYINTNGTIGFDLNTNNGTSATYSTITTATVLKVNTWYHLAAVRFGNTVKIYINGVPDVNTLDVTGLTVGSYNSTNKPIYIGVSGDASIPMTGNISNVRIVNGTAIYTSIFTPPTSNLTVVANTKLLTCQSNRFIETSANTTTTIVGSPQVQPFSPLSPTSAYSNTVVGGSVYLNGSTSYFTLPYNSNFDFNSGSALSFESWVYPTSYTNPVILANRNWSYGATGPTWGFFIVGATDIRWAIAGTGSQTFLLLENTTLVAPYNIPLNAWTHVAFTRDTAGNNKIFVNGYLVAARADSQTLASASGSIYIGIPSSGGNYTQSYISNLRLVSNSIPVSYQTSNTTIGTQIFTPPTAPFTSSSTANTTLLINGTNGGIIDSTQKNVISTIGNASVANTQSKVGKTSVFLDGTTYLQLMNANNILSPVSSSSNFTIESWIYQTQLGSDATGGRVIGDMNPTAATQNWSFGPNSIGQLVFYWFDGAAKSANSKNIVPLNTWTHVAASVTSGSIKLYINGIQEITTGTSTLTTQSSTVNYIVSGAMNNDRFYGYIDDLRVTNGYGRYNYNFTPPYRGLPNR